MVVGFGGRPVQVVVNGVRDERVRQWEGIGVLAQRRRRVGVPEASLRLQDLAPTRQEVATLWRSQCSVAPSAPAWSRISANRRPSTLAVRR